MKTVAAAFLSLLMLSVVTDASSTPVAYTFSGTLTDIRNSGAGIAFGTAFAGTYTHDDGAHVGSLIEPGRQLYAGGQFGVSAGATTLLGGSTSELQVFDNWTSLIGGYDQDDGYFVSSQVYDANGTDFYLIQFDLWDFTGSTLTSLGMPSQIQFTQLATIGRVWIRRFEGGTETGLASGNFGAMVSQAVPEPSTLFLCLASLIGLGLSLRRRTSAA